MFDFFVRFKCETTLIHLHTHKEKHVEKVRLPIDSYFHEIACKFAKKQHFSECESWCALSVFFIGFHGLPLFPLHLYWMYKQSVYIGWQFMVLHFQFVVFFFASLMFKFQRKNVFRFTVDFKRFYSAFARSLSLSHRFFAKTVLKVIFKIDDARFIQIFIIHIAIYFSRASV